MNKGKLIVIEGIDGSGKTTLVGELKKRKNELKIQNVQFKSGFDKKMFTEELNEIAKTNQTTRRKMFSPRLRSMIWFDDFINNVYTEYVETMQSGTSIITDRYKLSNEVFMTYYGLNDLNFLSTIREDLPKEDLIIYLDVTVEEAIHRIESRGNDIDPYEKKSNLVKLKKIYDRKIASHSNIVKVNANQELSSVVSEVIKCINQLV